MKLFQSSFITSLQVVQMLGVGLWAASAHAVDGPIIHEIELQGVQAISAEEIEASIEVSTGVSLQSSVLQRTIDNIRQLYRSHGFESADVHTEVVTKKSSVQKNESVLEIHVQEGVPTRISQIEFVASVPTADWSERKLGLLKKTAIHSGDLLDQDKIQLARRTIQDELAAQEYVGARVLEVKATIDSAPSPLPEAENVDSKQPSQWKRLTFTVELGDRVAFGFQGNTVFSKSDILGWIDDMRSVGFSTDYVTAIRDRILAEYRNAAFYEAQVQVFTFERERRNERYLSFVITEGTRVMLDRVHFEGSQAFTEDELRSQWFARAPLLTSRHYYVEAEAQKATDSLIEWVRSKGYLSAKLGSLTRSYDPGRKVMNLSLVIYEGDQTRVDRIMLEGVSAIKRDRALQILSLKEAEPLNLYAFSEGVDALKQEYRNLGYLEVKIKNEDTDQVVRYAQENRIADIHLDVQEGPRFKLGAVEIEGLKNTQKVVVEREVVHDPDGYLTEISMQQTDIRLKRLGIFARIAIRPIPDRDRADVKILQISIEEADPGILSGGFGLRTDLGYRAFGQIAYNNLWQKNHTSSFSIAANQRFYINDFCVRNRTLVGTSSNPFSSAGCFMEVQAEAAYNWPWFANVPGLTFHPQIDIERTMYLNFNKNAIIFSSTFSKVLLEQPALSAALTYSLERVDQFNAVNDLDNRPFLRIGSITPRVTLDTRDNPLIPSKGIFATASYEVADPAFLSQSEPFPIGFTNFNFRTDLHHTLFSDIHAYFSFRTGIQRNTEAPPTNDSSNPNYRIPISRQFSLGGVGSLRGFKEGGLNVDDVAIRGYLTYVNYRSQLDFPFAGALRFGPFLDAANLFVDTYSLGNLRYGAGFGFHFRSPVGPVNFDWGFNLNPRYGEDTNRFYFSIGIL